MKFYHCSYICHKVGEIILPHIDGRDYGGGRGIYCSSSPVPHSTLYNNVDKRNDLNNSKLYVYRVLPVRGKWYYGIWNDIVCFYGVEIIESLGQAARNKKVSNVWKNGYTKISYINGKNLNKPRWLLTSDEDALLGWNKNKKGFFKKGFKKKPFLFKYIEKNKAKLIKVHGPVFFIFDRVTTKKEKINLLL